MQNDTISIPLNKLFWFVEENVARSATGHFRNPADRHNLASLLVPGWDGQLGRPAVAELTKDQVAEAVTRLEEAWKALKDAPLGEEPEAVKLEGGTVYVAKAELAKVFEATYTKDGKIVKPTHKAVTCFRRGESLLLVNTLRAKKGLEQIAEIPCVVRHYENSLEQFSDNIRENQLKTAGANSMSNADCVGAARRLFQLGATEAKLLHAFGLKRGMAQKLHRLCQLDAKYPKQAIVDKIVSGELSDKPFDKEKVKAMLDSGVTEDKVGEFIAAPNAGNAPKIMSRKSIEALGSGNPIELVKLVCQAILKDDPSQLAAITAKAEAVNAAIKQVMA